MLSIQGPLGLVALKENNFLCPNIAVSLGHEIGCNRWRVAMIFNRRLDSDTVEPSVKLRVIEHLLYLCKSCNIEIW